MKRDKIACECRHITYGKIDDAIKAGAASFEEVQEMTGCAKSCGKCQEFIEYLVKDLLREQNEGRLL
ncbi:MAG: (2Fe-2S)-binding protein [Parasporobacterium sp.]|nr:(2Fe-2S)-binding protein [Parasporobacterium sp.]